MRDLDPITFFNKDLGHNATGLSCYNGFFFGFKGCSAREKCRNVATSYECCFNRHCRRYFFLFFFLGWLGLRIAAAHLISG